MFYLSIYSSIDCGGLIFIVLSVNMGKRHRGRRGGRGGTTACCGLLSNVGTGDGADIWLNLDCCGLVCATITYSLLTFASFVVTYCVILPWLWLSAWGCLHLFLFNSLVVLAIVSHVKAMCTNPGAVPRFALPLDAGESKPRTVCA